MRLERIAWAGGEPPSEAAVHERLVADGFSPFQWSDAPGAVYESHSHPHDESLWVLAGRIDFVIVGESHRLGPGDRLQLPADTEHAAEAGPQGATYVIGQRLG
jgi:quercetin dioxygenase-like cupin family protein